MSTRESASSSQQSLLAELNTYALEVFKENNRIAALIEDKAQKNITVAGLITSAGLAFLKAGIKASLSYAQRGFLTLAVLLVTTSMLCSLWVVKVSANPNMPELNERFSYVMDLLRLPWYSLNGKVMRNSRRDFLETWLFTIENQTGLNQQKARVLNVAQALLVLALVFVASVLILTLA